MARERRAFARDPELAREAGRKGGYRRREANAQEVELLRLSDDGELMHVPDAASGRTLRKVARLVKLGYWAQAETGYELPEHKSYQITEAGRAFLATLA